MRSRLIFSYVLISLATLLVTMVYLHHSLKQTFAEHTVPELELKARMISKDLSNALPTNFSYGTVDALVDELGTENFVRLTFVDTEGTVWGDTAYDEDDLKEMDNLQNRPEIQAALAEGSGGVTLYSDTQETNMRYLAVPVLREDRLIGVCRVVLPTQGMLEFATPFKSAYIPAIVIGLVSTLMLGLIAAKIVTSPIRRFLRTAKLIADGRISIQVSNNSSDELGRLTQHFSQMADCVKHQIHEISQERDRLETILANMVEGVLLIDEKFSIVYANPAAVLMLNLSADYRGHPLIETIRDPRLQELLSKSQDTRKSAFAELKLVGNCRTRNRNHCCSRCRRISGSDSRRESIEKIRTRESRFRHECLPRNTNTAHFNSRIRRDIADGGFERPNDKSAVCRENFSAIIRTITACDRPSRPFSLGIRNGYAYPRTL